MEINSVTLTKGSAMYTPPTVLGNLDSGNEEKLGTKPELTIAGSKMENTEEREKPIDDPYKITNDMNKIIELFTADLKFVLHDKTKRLMVQLIDIKEQKVLKEFPPHQLLDTLAAIREYVGVLLDKKA
ncbi:flagellar protein FlaG [Sporomusa ovata DSM 2662]|uniref:CDS_ID OB2502 n=1 Tax=Sporomusa ovata TaxID=2378 RepID=A0A0U1KU92_9FIRM|nr:flagellar protein FlaG [Sporomusa ovata]EQB26373.1 flagellar protein FlaG [Sporomusa ovata DSM 2662]CQR70453.1 CDS_ID OB2502 [Sporomusa ovata]